MKKKEGHEEMARVLVEELHHPVEVEEDKHGFTPVFAAAQKGHVSVLEVLHKAKAKLDVVAKPGLTPLMVAAQQGQAKVVEWLADHGCKLDQALPSGATAMFLAGISSVTLFHALLTDTNTHTDTHKYSFVVVIVSKIFLKKKKNLQTQINK
jgi:ankyrin repeat protein